MKLFLDLPWYMPSPHAKLQKNWCTSFREKLGQDTQGHSFIIIRICPIVKFGHFGREKSGRENKNLSAKSKSRSKESDVKPRARQGNVQ